MTDLCGNSEKEIDDPFPIPSLTRIDGRKPALLLRFRHANYTLPKQELISKRSPFTVENFVVFCSISYFKIAKIINRFTHINLPVLSVALLLLFLLLLFL